MRLIDLSGHVFGKLMAVERVGSGPSGALWLCKCECGEVTISPGTNLRLGKTTSCGCGRRGSNSAHFSGYKDIGSHYWGHVKFGAAQRSIEFSISMEEVWDLYEKQNRKCALSGLDIKFHPSSKIVPKAQTASIDRIDNSKGYVRGNIQLLHKDVNKMKNVHDQDYFIFLCKQIAAGR